MTEKQEVGRRERKKLMLREALITAAYELFAVKGFDETRVEDITEQVDVSTRTFFRYFASKEDVVLDYQEAEHEDFMAALNRRPTGEPALSAIHHAAVEVVRGCESGSYGFDADRFMTLQELLRSHPLVRAKNLQNSVERRDSIVKMIALRMGTDSVQDIRPTVLVWALDYAHLAAHDLWKKNPGIPYSDVLDKIFGVIEQGLNFQAYPLLQPDLQQQKFNNPVCDDAQYQGSIHHSKNVIGQNTK
ncbi:MULTISPECIES: TetR family transcriptional regulator [Pseudomonas]|uniref:TetR family transcriptional regulator n=1 Tax=Pseudomonas juntendi TaxID=2666183 RepID=A0A7W2LI08_9PSED|nr:MULTISPECIES: TetR family transcriptional regulator [Pseudomonas]PPB17131.1 TetR family transcriptional regulator [Pseudomonas aeruginosa]QEQ88348.1 TetR family transcriptional regulator [Pseudomonas putida]MBA6141233.1 TetR family transcriptional regulator [Pseudomonas juntendi]MCL8327795.1 TetR family transcriptional regulator [Pseudomonas juntendi]RRV24029.1 TetR family transcriptional regulator [Pseudomonas sp. p99-361]